MKDNRRKVMIGLCIFMIAFGIFMLILSTGAIKIPFAVQFTLSLIPVIMGVVMLVVAIKGDGQAPGQPGQVPGQPGQAPGQMPGFDPSQMGQMPGQPGQMPNMGPGMAPGMTPGMTPEVAPDHKKEVENKEE